MASSILASARAEPAPPSRARRTRVLAVGGAVFVALLIVTALAAPGFAAVVVGGLVGATLGLLAGFRGGWTDSIIMTLADAQLAFPFILLAIGIIAVLGPSFPTLIVVIGLSGWVTYARVLRSQVLVL